MNVMTVRQAQATGTTRGDRHERTIWPFAALLAAAGFVMLGYALLSEPGWLTGLALTVCGANPTGPHAVLLAGVLLVLAWGMARRRQTAWALTLGLMVWSAAAEIEAVIAPSPAAPWRLAPLGFAIIGFWHARNRFRVPLNAVRLKQVAEISALSATAILLVGGGGLFMERSRFETPLSTPDIGREVISLAAANPGPTTFDGPAWQINGLALLSGALLVFALGWLLASAPAPRPGGRAQRAILRAMISHPDSETLAPFALRYDKSYVFSPDGRAAISYRVLAGMAVASGDPVNFVLTYADGILSVGLTDQIAQKFLGRSMRGAHRKCLLDEGTHDLRDKVGEGASLFRAQKLPGGQELFERNFVRELRAQLSAQQAPRAVTKGRSAKRSGSPADPENFTRNVDRRPNVEDVLLRRGDRKSLIWGRGRYAGSGHGRAQRRRIGAQPEEAEGYDYCGQLRAGKENRKRNFHRCLRDRFLKKAISGAT